MTEDWPFASSTAVTACRREIGLLTSVRTDRLQEAFLSCSPLKPQAGQRQALTETSRRHCAAPRIPYGERGERHLATAGVSGSNRLWLIDCKASNKRHRLVTATHCSRTANASRRLCSCSAHGRTTRTASSTLQRRSSSPSQSACRHHSSCATGKRRPLVCEL
jgi:hypothetical protein